MVPPLITPGRDLGQFTALYSVQYSVLQESGRVVSWAYMALLLSYPTVNGRSEGSLEGSQWITWSELPRVVHLGPL